MRLERKLASSLLLAAVFSWALPAEASDEEDFGIGAGIVSLAAVDLSFSIRAIVLAADRGDAQFELSLAQSIVSVPQAIAFNGAIVGFLQDNDGGVAFAALHIPATMTTALAVHGLWSLASPDEDQAFMFLASTAIGVNTMWTSFVLGTAISDEDNFDDEAAIPGLYEVITTAPGIAIGIHQALETDRFTAGWAAIAGWSGMLTLHGALFSTGLFNPDERYDDYTARSPLKSFALAPTSLGPPVEGAPHTPGVIASGTF